MSTIKHFYPSIISGHVFRFQLYCFYIAYTHPLGDLDVPFGGDYFWPIYLRSILRPLLTLINGA